MKLSDIGKVIEYEWNKSFQIRSELYCDCFVIMPNHVHAVVFIDSVETHGPVETHGRASLRNPNQSQRETQPIAIRLPKSISSFVAGFKSSTTKQINEWRNTPRIPVWQPRFHDRIIRNGNELNQRRGYIDNNPKNWIQDEHHISSSTISKMETLG